MGWLSKAFKNVVKVATFGTLPGKILNDKEKEKEAKAKANAQLVAQQNQAMEMQASEQGSSTKRRQQTRAASLLGSYNPDATDTLLG